MRSLYFIVAVLAAFGAPAHAGLFGSSEYARIGADSTGRWSAMLTRQMDSDPCAAAPSQIASVGKGDIAPAATHLAAQPALCRPKGKGLQALRAALRNADELPLLERIRRVNRVVNDVPYVDDKANYGTEDYWANLSEFAARGGDCEDYAIAKYMLLKSVGISSDSMRVAVVQDLALSAPHAVLAVDIEGKTYILDNQAEDVQTDSQINYYQPVYSVNERGWWLHMPE